MTNPAGAPASALVEKAIGAYRKATADYVTSIHKIGMRAAISIVVEECAEKAASFDWYSTGMPSGVKPKDVEALSYAIAAAIRSLDAHD